MTVLTATRPSVITAIVGTTGEQRSFARPALRKPLTLGRIRLAVATPDGGRAHHLNLKGFSEDSPETFIGFTDDGRTCWISKVDNQFVVRRDETELANAS